MFWVLFAIVFMIVAAILVYVVVGGISEYIKNNNSPVVEVSAKVVDKRKKVMRNGAAVHRFWYVTFETNGALKELSVGRGEHERLNIGDSGILRTRGTRYLGFDVK